MKETYKNSELQLADQVTRHDTLGVVTVKQIKDGFITFFRPYTHTADFSHTGGVICYVGIEEWKEDVGKSSFYGKSGGEWTLIDRKELK